MTSKISRTTYNNILKQYGSIKNIPIDLLKNLELSLYKELINNQEFLDIVHEYWNKVGFPYDTMTEKEMFKDYCSLKDFDERSIFNRTTKELGQNISGLGVVNSMHPNRFSVQCRNFRTPMQNFMEKDIFTKVLKKVCSDFGNGNPFDNSDVRSILKVFSGTHAVSNFRPTVAKWIYNNYCPAGGKVLDPSMGWGGRLLGALLSNISLYEATDPATETCKNNQKLYEIIKKFHNKNKLKSFIEMESSIPEVNLLNIPFEEYDNKPNTFDLVFTSPPYFNIEKYTDEDTQSWKRYSEYGDWVEHFLLKLFKISYKVLKPGGYIAINIAGSVGKNNLETSTVDCGNFVFKKKTPDDIIYLTLSKMVGTKKGGQGRNARHDHKLEPIFIWKKIDN